jgi:hypothetical protein
MVVLAFVLHEIGRRNGIMFQRILVPLDGSELAESILPYIEDLASTHKSKIVLLRVAHTLPGQDDIKAEVEAVPEAEGYLKEIEGKTVIDFLVPFTYSLY